jgi:hypothetical protein
MTVEEVKKEAAKKLAWRRKLVNKVIKANENLADLPLLNWSMNQLFRTARELELLTAVYCQNESISAIGADAAATVILKKLVKTKEGWDLIYMTNPKLLRGYRKPK